MRLLLLLTQHQNYALNNPLSEQSGENMNRIQAVNNPASEPSNNKLHI